MTEVKSIDEFTLVSSGVAELLACFGLGVNYVYGAEGRVSPIDNDTGKHKLATEEKGLASILVSATLSFVKGSNFCPETATWVANYVLYTIESADKKAQGWLALYEGL